MLWLALWGCSGPGPGSQQTSDTAGDATSGFRLTSGPTYEHNLDLARLVGFVHLQTSAPATVTVEVDDGGRTWTHTSDEPATEHRIRILGLRPAATHDFAVTATSERGENATGHLSFTTDPLPDDFPSYTFEGDPSRMEPGVTLTLFGGYVAMLDPEGTVRWYLRTGPDPFVTGITPSHTLLAYSGRTQLLEYDLAGAVIGSWRAARATDEPAAATPVDIDAIHHDAIEMPSGNLLVLSVEQRWIPGFPSSEDDPLAPPQDAWVAGDVVVELRRDGTVVNRWALLDLLDPMRIGYDSLTSDYWSTALGQVADWSHGNAVSYDAARDEVIVSLRHQDAVVAISRATGQLAWIVAPDENWREPWASSLLRPAVPTLRPYHQHGAKITPSGTLMLFDNGNHRASPHDNRFPDALNASRGVELRLDHAAGTYTPVFTYGSEQRPLRYASVHGDCDPMPATGNVLVTYGRVQDASQPAVQIEEVTRDDPPEIVSSLTLDHPNVASGAERVTGVIPGF